MGSASDRTRRAGRRCDAGLAVVPLLAMPTCDAAQTGETAAAALPTVLLAGLLVLLVFAAIFWGHRTNRAAQAHVRRLKHEIERYRLLAEIGSDWVWETDADHRFCYLSERFSTLCGIDSDAVLGRSRLELSGADPNTEPWSSHLQALERREAFRNFVYSTRHPNGRIEWFQISGHPMYDTNGAFCGYHGTAARITESVERNRHELEQRTLFDYILRAMPEAMIITTPQREVIVVKDAVANILGFERDELIGKSTRILYADPAEYEEQGRVRFNPTATELLQPYVVQYRRKDGSIFPGETLGTVIRSNHDGKVVGYLGLIRDATERQRTDEALRLAKEQAEYANRAKSEFLALMSHELRTPLNAILGFSDIVRQEIFGPVGDTRYREYVNDIHTSGQHLLSVINDLLDLSRIEAGRLELQERAIDLDKLVAACQRLVVDRAREGGLTLEADIPASLPALRADERLLRQILLNLLSNAIKFTDRGGSISVVASMGGDGGIQVAVIDTGIGIAAEDIPKVLQPFRRAVTTRRQVEGAGIGLYLVQSLMRAHGGVLAIESTLGEGTRIILSFPSERTVTAQVATAL